MKVSILKNGEFIVGVDYSSRKDCEKVIEITQEEFQLLKDGGTIKNEKIIAKVIKEKTKEEILQEEKQYLISQYKEKQKEIQEIKAEILDIEETLESKTDQGKALATARKSILQTRLSEVRIESDTIAEEGITKFGEGIISEF